VIGLSAQQEALPEHEVLLKRREIIAEDVIVMTQACDLEHDKVSDVVLCPHYALSSFRDEVWKPDQEQKRQKTNSESWQKYYKAIANGHLWNLCVLNSSSGTDHEIRANFDRVAGATCGGWARFRMPGAYNPTARHAGECAE
jgi:hypothetical protein